MPPRFQALLIGMGISLLGCQVPAYQLPGGFSSSYHRQLFGEPFTGSDSITEPPRDSSGVFYPQTFRYQPPSNSEIPRVATLPDEELPNRRRRF